jgi:hypothetical protein
MMLKKLFRQFNSLWNIKNKEQINCSSIFFNLYIDVISLKKYGVFWRYISFQILRIIGLKTGPKTKIKNASCKECVVKFGNNFE